MAGSETKKKDVSGASRRLRRAGPVPDIVYGGGRGPEDMDPAEAETLRKRLYEQTEQDAEDRTVDPDTAAELASEVMTALNVERMSETLEARGKGMEAASRLADSIFGPMDKPKKRPGIRQVKSGADPEALARTREWLVERNGLDEINYVREWLIDKGFDASGEMDGLDAAQAEKLSAAVDAVPNVSWLARITFKGFLSRGQKQRLERQIHGLRRVLKYDEHDVPDDLADLDEASADALKKAVSEVVAEADAKDAFRKQIDEGQLRRAAAGAIRERADMALRELGIATEDFRSALSRGMLDPERVPYVARKRFFELFGPLLGDEMAAGSGGKVRILEDRIRTLEAEVEGLRAVSTGKDSGLAALEAEVAAMLETGKAPELYSERADRKEKPQEFLQRVYGKYLGKGREAVYLFQLRKIDPKFVHSLETACWKTGADVGELVPKRRQRTDRELGAATDDAEKLAKAVLAIRKRRSREKT